MLSYVKDACWRVYIKNDNTILYARRYDIVVYGDEEHVHCRRHDSAATRYADSATSYATAAVDSVDITLAFNRLSVYTIISERQYARSPCYFESFHAGVSLRRLMPPAISFIFAMPRRHAGAADFAATPALFFMARGCWQHDDTSLYFSPPFVPETLLPLATLALIIFATPINTRSRRTTALATTYRERSMPMTHRYCHAIFRFR